MATVSGQDSVFSIRSLSSLRKSLVADVGGCRPVSLTSIDVTLLVILYICGPFGGSVDYLPDHPDFQVPSLRAVTSEQNS